MATLPQVPALHLAAPPQPPDLLDQYSKITALKQALAEGPLRQQVLQQQADSGQIALQQQQQTVQDQQAFRQTMTDPKMQGKTLGEVADHLAMNGKISQQGWMSAKKADLEQRQSLATLDKDSLANAAAAHKATQELYDSVMQLPDDQLAANWPQIAQQYDAIPGNSKIPLNPNQPLSKQQLSQFGPMISMQATYLDEANKRAKDKADLTKTQADAQLAQANAERGGTTDMDKFVFDYLKSNNLENTPANRQKAFQEYTRETKIQPAEVRAQTFLQMPQAVADPNNPGQTVFVTRQNAIGQQAPNSGDVKSVQATQKYFSPAGKGGQNLAAFNTALNHLQLLGQASDALGNNNLTLWNDLSQKYAKATGDPAPTNFDAVKNAVKGEVSRALTGNVTVSEQAELDKDFNNASSPQQIRGVIQKYTQLMQGKKDVLRQQYTDGMSGKVSFDDNSSAPLTATHRYNPATRKIEVIANGR